MICFTTHLKTVQCGINLNQLEITNGLTTKKEEIVTLINRFEGDDVLIVYFQDVRIIDDSRISSLGQELGELINNTSNSRIILNFQNVGFMSSAMIGKLVLFGKKCKEAKVKLRLCTIGENVEEVFKLMRLNKVFDIDKNEETSIKKIKK